MALLDFGLIGLFCGTFLTATLIPFPSDVIVIGIYEAGYPILPSLIVATIGNLLGGLTNYFIGYKSHSEKLVRRFKLDQEKLDRWEKRLSKWGIYLGLITFLPIIGEPLIAALGFFRVKFFPLAGMMLIGIFTRYVVLTMLYLWW